MDAFSLTTVVVLAKPFPETVDDADDDDVVDCHKSNDSPWTGEVDVTGRRTKAWTLSVARSSSNKARPETTIPRPFLVFEHSGVIVMIETLVNFDSTAEKRRIL